MFLGIQGDVGDYHYHRGLDSSSRQITEAVSYTHLTLPTTAEV